MTDSTTDSTGIVVTRHGHHVMFFQRRLDHPLERVWAALTEPELLARWLAGADVELAEGGEIELRWLNDPSGGAVMNGVITELDPPTVLEYEGGDFYGLIRWELAPDATGCTLTFSCTVEAPYEDLAESMAGWHMTLDYLAGALDGHPVDWPNWTVGPDFTGPLATYRRQLRSRSTQ
jgi:uncharacterized protein YndB with AHSA1/START domain